MDNCFLPADILLPAVQKLERWAVIACDQYTSDSSYWNRVKDMVGDSPSARNMILPEAELAYATEQTIQNINDTMRRYLEQNVFLEHPKSYVYVERTLLDGSVRQGIVGMIDLECYDFRTDSAATVRATEETVLERIPPRVAVRRNAELEFPHVILFCNDAKQRLIEGVAAIRHTLPKLYSFNLMEGGGHIAGWLLSEGEAQTFAQALQSYVQDLQDVLAYVVADGNHSLVTAKRCYEELKQQLPEEQWRCHPARYALVELENVYSPVIKFEPIHRVITETDPWKLLAELKSKESADGCPIRWVIGQQTGIVHLPLAQKELPVGALQRRLDAWLESNPGKIDYIHDDEALMSLASAEQAIGFLLPAMDKKDLFPYIAAGNTLPRKTFSLGHAAEKRYYLEGRKIR